MDDVTKAVPERTPIPPTPWRFCGNREIRCAVDPDNQGAETLVAILPAWMPPAQRQVIGQHIVDCVNAVALNEELMDGGQDAHPTEPGCSTGDEELSSEESGDLRNACVSEG